MKIARNYLFIPLVAFLFCVVAAATKAEEKASDKPEKVTKDQTYRSLRVGEGA